MWVLPSLQAEQQSKQMLYLQGLTVCQHLGRKANVLLRVWSHRNSAFQDVETIAHYSGIVFRVSLSCSR